MVCYVMLCYDTIGGRPLDQSWAAAVPLGRRAHLPTRRGAVRGVLPGGCGGHRQESGVHRAAAKHGASLLQHKHEAHPPHLAGVL